MKSSLNYTPLAQRGWHVVALLLLHVVGFVNWCTWHNQPSPSQMVKGFRNNCVQCLSLLCAVLICMSLSRGGLGGLHYLLGYSSACYIRSLSAFSIHRHPLHSIDDFNQSIPSSKAITAESIINTHYGTNLTPAAMQCRGGCRGGSRLYSLSI